MDDVKWFDYWFSEFNKTQQETISNHENELKLVYNNMLDEVGRKNGDHINRLEKLGLEPKVKVL